MRIPQGQIVDGKESNFSNLSMIDFYEMLIAYQQKSHCSCCLTLASTP